MITIVLLCFSPRHPAQKILQNPGQYRQIQMIQAALMNALGPKVHLQPAGWTLVTHLNQRNYTFKYNLAQPYFNLKKILFPCNKPECKRTVDQHKHGKMSVWTETALLWKAWGFTVLLIQTEEITAFVTLSFTKKKHQACQVCLDKD